MPVGTTITLDLNGHTIDRGLTGATTKDSVITIKGTLTVKDTGTGGKITGGYNGLGGGVYVADGGQFTLSGGSITGNNASLGGGVCVLGGTFTLSGGSITGNNAMLYGGGLYVATAMSTFTMTGGNITQNTATKEGGGVYVNGTFNISGNPTVTGNTLTNDTANNVYLDNQFTITVTDKMYSTTCIGVTLADITKPITSGLYGNGSVSNFTSDNTANSVGWNADFTEAMLGTPIAYTPPTAYSGTYDGAAHKALTSPVTASDATVTYSLDGKSFSGDIPTITNVGDYTVWYRVAAKDTANYVSSSGSVVAKIAAAPAPAPAPETPSVVSPAPTGPAVTINKAPTSVKAKAKKNKVTVSWKKIKKTKKTKALRAQIKSIEVQVATDQAFTNIVATKTVSKTKTKATLKLNRKTVYYVRIRYVGADGVSNWSKVKRVKTK